MSQAAEIRDVDLEQYVYDETQDYVEVDNELFHIREHLKMGGRLLFEGPQGIGKTLSFAHVASKHGIPCIMFPCSRDTKKKHLVVRPWIEVENGEKKSVYIPGHLLLGIQAANEYGEAMVVLEEMNALLPHMQKSLNEMLDWRQEINVPEAGAKFELEDGANLLVGATMNPPEFGGTFDLNDDLYDRFHPIQRRYPNSRKFENILEKNSVPNKIGSRGDIRKQVQSFAREVHQHFMNEEIEYDMTPRSAVSFAETWNQYYRTLSKNGDPSPEKEALRRALIPGCLGRYRDENQREIVADEAEKVFGVRPELQ